MNNSTGVTQFPAFYGSLPCLHGSHWSLCWDTNCVSVPQIFTIFLSTYFDNEILLKLLIWSDEIRNISVSWPTEKKSLNHIEFLAYRPPHKNWILTSKSGKLNLFWCGEQVYRHEKLSQSLLQLARYVINWFLDVDHNSETCFERQ
jgi:hypothetical protein